MNRSQKTGFTLSILLNVLLIGIVAGYAFSPMHHRGERPRFQELEDRLAEMPIADEKKAEVVRLFKEGFAKQQEERAHMQQMRNKVEHILKTDPLDKTALHRAFAEIQTVQQGLHEDMSNLLVTVAERLNADERKELAKVLHRFSGKGKRR